MSSTSCTWIVPAVNYDKDKAASRDTLQSSGLKNVSRFEQASVLFRGFDGQMVTVVRCKMTYRRSRAVALEIRCSLQVPTVQCFFVSSV